MADDDEVYDETFFDPTQVPEGPRRSTFTPPTGTVPTQPGDAAPHDDDELANAMAAGLPAEPEPQIWSPAPEAAQFPIDDAGGQNASSTLDAIKQLEEQLKQREAEALAQREWEQQAGMPPAEPVAPVVPVTPVAPGASDEPPVIEWGGEPQHPVSPEPEPQWPGAAQQPEPQWTAPAEEPQWQAPADAEPQWPVAADPESQWPVAAEPVQPQWPTAEPEPQWPAPAEQAPQWPAAAEAEPQWPVTEQAEPQWPAAPAAEPEPQWPAAAETAQPLSPVEPEPEYPEWPTQHTEPATADWQATPAADVPDMPAWPPAADAPEATAFETPLPEAPTPAAPIPDGMLPEAPAPAESEPPAAPEAQAPPELPAWDVPAPSPTWSPGPDYDADADYGDSAPAMTEPAAEHVGDHVAEHAAPIPDVMPEPEPEVPHVPLHSTDLDAEFAAAIIPSPPASPSDIPKAVIETEGVEVEPLLPPPPKAPVSPAAASGIREAVIETEGIEGVQVERLDFEPRGGSTYSPPPLVEPVQTTPLLPSTPPKAGTAAIGDDAPPPPIAGTAATGADAPPPPPSAAPAAPLAFDDLLAGAEEPPHGEPASGSVKPENLFIEPVSAGEEAPTDTGSISIVDQSYEEELPDDVDETDRVPGSASADPSDIAGLIAPPSGPIPTQRVRDDEVVLIEAEPVRQRILAVETTGAEPTPQEYRVGQAARLFWLWFAANSSILSLGLGATIFAVGMSLRQSIIAVLAGVLLSFIPLGISTAAGKRSGQPTMVVSRATFGLVGNVVPAVLALVTRLFWGAALLWLLGSSVALVLVGAKVNGILGERQLLLVALAVAFLVAVLIAFAGYALIARIQLVLTIISVLLIGGLIAMTAQYINLSHALANPEASWIVVITGAVLVFSFVGLVWAQSGGDLARYQQESSGEGASGFWAGFGAALPSFLLIGYGALLAASNPVIATGFVNSPLKTLALMLPNWYPVPVIASTALSLLSGVILTIYSGGFALQAISPRMRRPWSIVIVAVLLGAFATLLTFGVSGGVSDLFRDVATTIAVPTAAWVGIFAIETIMRKMHFDSDSLLKSGGVYPAVRWGNLVALLVVTAIGFALTTAQVTWLSWQGYGFTLLGVPLDSDLATTDIGVIAALLFGMLAAFLTGLPGVRRQEAKTG